MIFFKFNQKCITKLIEQEPINSQNSHNIHIIFLNHSNNYTDNPRCYTTPSPTLTTQSAYGTCCPEIVTGGTSDSIRIFLSSLKTLQ